MEIVVLMNKEVHKRECCIDFKFGWLHLHFDIKGNTITKFLFSPTGRFFPNYSHMYSKSYVIMTSTFSVVKWTDLSLDVFEFVRKALEANLPVFCHGILNIER